PGQISPLVCGFLRQIAGAGSAERGFGEAGTWLMTSIARSNRSSSLRTLIERTRPAMAGRKASFEHPGENVLDLFLTSARVAP
ncbi:hypothetical protein, partial [Bradyrhizobium sp.]|uniref:hypothetical protein n=1 Tax=Bradyrhizobium sp. TaxID=376 RepID=UPI003C14D396